MGSYVVRRLLQGVLVLWGVTLIIFFVIHAIPGNPARTILGPKASTEAVERLDHELGLDQGLPAQYVDYMKDLGSGDLGDSITGHAPVGELVGPRILPSIVLVVYALIITVLVAVPMALVSALRANRLPDHLIRAASVLMYAIPSFWFGLMLAVVFGLQMHVFPTSGFDRSFPAGWFQTLTLPAVTISLLTIPVMVRVLRTSLIETLGSDFVVASRARGLSDRRVLFRHALKGSLTSSVTFIGVAAGTLLSFAVVVEQVFAIPGLGSLLVSSVLARDYPTVQGLAIVFAIVVVIANLLADMTYGFLDPRVRI